MPRVSLGKALCRPALGTGGAGVGALACLRTSPSDGIFCCWWRGGGVERAMSAEGRGVVHGEPVDVRAMLREELGADVVQEYYPDEA